MAADPSTCHRIALAEIEAARHAPRGWREFVARAESETGLRWAELRVLIDPYVAAEYKRRETIAPAVSRVEGEA